MVILKEKFKDKAFTLLCVFIGVVVLFGLIVGFEVYRYKIVGGVKEKGSAEVGGSKHGYSFIERFDVIGREVQTDVLPNGLQIDYLVDKETNVMWVLIEKSGGGLTFEPLVDEEGNQILYEE